MEENKNFDETKLIHTEEVHQEIINEPSSEEEMVPQNNNYNNMALGYGRRPNYGKNKLDNQDNDSDDKLGKNKNNQGNHSNEAAKSLATGGNGNKKDKEDKDKKDKENKENKDKKEQNPNNKNKETTQKRHNSLADKKTSLRERFNPLNKLKGKKGKDESEVAQAAKKGIKALFMAIPLPIRLMILAGIVVFIFIILFIVILVTLLSGSSSTAYGNVYCGGTEYDISDITLSTATKTFEPGLRKWNSDSPQYQFLSKEESYADEDGFLRIDDAYVVALGDFFGTKKGTRYIITLEDGTSFTAVLGDTKSSGDANIEGGKNGKHRYHEISGTANIIEFMMACGESNHNVNFNGIAKSCPEETQSKIYEKFPGEISSIRALESDEVCNFNGDFMERTTSIYTDTKMINTLTSIEPQLKVSLNIPGLKYQCVTYARLRAMEIIYTTNAYTPEEKEEIYDVVGNSDGNAWQWIYHLANYKGDAYLEKWNNFSSDRTCKNLQPASLITFSGNGMRCVNSPTGYCGHVAIVEKVDTQKNTVTISDAYQSRGGWGIREFNINEVNGLWGGCTNVTHLLSYNKGGNYEKN